MPDGSKFTLDANKKEAEPTMYSAAKAGEETKSSTYNENVPQAGGNVNYSQRVSRDGLTNQRTVNGLVFIINICYTPYEPGFVSL